MRINPNDYAINPVIIIAGVACSNGMRMLANEILKASPAAKREIEHFQQVDSSLRGMLSIHVAATIVYRMNVAY
ncbi:hypothetical protein [Pseudomonas phage PSA11]|nr:hypothetical protein [Pseudomonas phage PSA11]